MRLAFVVASAVVVSLLLPISSSLAAAPAPVAIDVEFVTGSGQLSNLSTFAVNALSLVADIGARHIVKQRGALTIDGDSTECTIQSVAPDCSEATLLCEDETHDVAGAVAGVSNGSLDGVEVTSGLIVLACETTPPPAR
jgi:uncharacterized protein involved in type VI secretion and phage assembly